MRYVKNMSRYYGTVLESLLGFKSICQKVCLLTLLFLAFKLLFEKILHHFFAFIRTD